MKDVASFLLALSCLLLSFQSYLHYRSIKRLQNAVDNLNAKKFINIQPFSPRSSYMKWPQFFEELDLWIQDVTKTQNGEKNEIK